MTLYESLKIVNTLNTPSVAEQILNIRTKKLEKLIKELSDDKDNNFKIIKVNTNES